MAQVNIIDPVNFTLQSYNSQDENLISQFGIDTVLTGSSYIEFFIYDNNKSLLNSNFNYNSYTIENNGQSAGNNNEVSEIFLSPEVDVKNQGFSEGEYIAYYNFFTKRVGDPNTNLFISEISSDRTEIRLDSNILSNLDIIEQANNFIQFREDSDYFVDFYLNFGDNNLIIANNIKLSNETVDDPTIIVKLYEPLPPQLDLKNELWVVTTLDEPRAFNIVYPSDPITFQDSELIAGPNFNIPFKNEINNSSLNLSYNDIISNAPSSSQDQINSLLEESSINISVDYTNFNDFIHFSSAQTRIENFYYKISLIEQHSASISNLSNITSSSTSTVILQSKISDIIENFDKFEYFMYYSSGSAISYPKINSEPPYLLAKATSSATLTWLGSANESSTYYGGQILSASNFDNANPDQLKKAIPEYLREDTDNQLYDLFVDMVAQYYDNVWLYTKDVTQKYNADNRLDFGVSKDLVAETIRDFGVKLYQNNFSSDELYTAFLGLTPSNSLFPFPEITGSLPTPTGFEFVDTLISASNDVIPLDNVNKSLYKRIYHNLPYLLKSKGTIAGLRALITSYGIPDTILRISEFGGKDQVNENDWDYHFNKFNYTFNTEGTNHISTPWVINFNKFPGVIVRNPRTVQFRFKPELITGSVSPFGLSSVSQSLWYAEHLSIQSSIVLEYTGSGLSSGSYSGSIKDPYYQYGTLKYIDTSGASASLYLPFFDGGWWSVMATVDSNVSASLFAGNKIYNGKDGTTLGYFSSSKASAVGWGVSGGTSFFAKSRTGYSNFSGSLQEIRYYAPTISESVFKDYIMNPLSIEGNSINSSPNELVFRAGLGSELDISNTLTGTSIHPKVTGSWDITSSFPSNSTYTFNNTASYVPNTETYFLDQFPAGIKNRVTDKIRFEDNVLPTGDTLSAYRRVAQQTEASASYTDNINYLEVAFSPQNQINDDIMGQLGYFNIGDYIGDPRQRFTGSRYEDLNNLSEEYFKKYIKNYDLVDFVRLIKFFDNSLFKMIKDFIPARTSLASGLVIKQHLLERNKYPQPSAHREEILLTSSIDIGDIKGGPGGSLNSLNLPPREIIMEFSTTSSLLPVSSASLFGPFASLTASLSSSLRGGIAQFNIPASSSVTSDIIEMYDGEEFFIKIKKQQTSTKTFIEWKITDPNDTSKYGFYAFGGVDFTFPAINFSSPTLVRYKGSQVAGGDNFEGNEIKWDEDNDILSLNYLPTKTLYPYDQNVQSWNEAFSSLSGSITKVRDSQYEFYNGEFSGSTVLITNGELNEECDEFKNVSTTPVPYFVRFYFNGGGDLDGFDANLTSWINSNNLPLDGFISIYYNNNAVTKPGAPPPGVLYLKIPKIDNTSKDQSVSLQSLTQVTIPSSTGNVTYQITVLNEEPTYYLYEVIPNTATPDVSTFGKLNYDFTGSLTQTATFNGNQLVPIPIISQSGDTFNFYSSTNQSYIFNTYAQKDLFLKATGSVNVSSPNLDIALIVARNGIITTSSIEILSNTGTITTGSGKPFSVQHSFSSSLPGDRYYVAFTKGIASGLSNAEFIITSSAATATSSIDTVLEPYFSKNFSRVFDCQPLLNNVQGERSNPFLQDLDYQTSQTTPINLDAVISGSATKATVPESMFTIASLLNPKHSSINQSEKINEWTNSPNNIGTYGKTPSINSLDTNIYEFEWGGSTAPEILGYGSFKMGRILQVQNEESARIINASDGLTSQVQAFPFYKSIATISAFRKLVGINAPAGVSPNNATGSLPDGKRFWTISQSIGDYYYNLNFNNPVNTEITPFMYPNVTAGSNPVIPKSTKILTTEFGVPTISSYALTSSNSNKYGSIGFSFSTGFIQISRSINISKVDTDSNGFYNSGNTIKPTFANIGDQIVEDLNNNERWFVTLYNEFEFPNGTGDYNSVLTSGSLSPYNVGYNTLDSNGNYPNPLANRGVYEIAGVRDEFSLGNFEFVLRSPFLQSNGSAYTTTTLNIKNIGGGIAGNSLGMLIWKARASNKTEFVIVQDEITGGITAGAFTNKFAPQEVIDNFDTITRDFGSNTT